MLSWHRVVYFGLMMVAGNLLAAALPDVKALVFMFGMLWLFVMFIGETVVENMLNWWDRR